MTTNLSMRELTEKDLKEAVEMYIAVFSAEPWNDQLTVPQITEYVSSMMAMNTYIGYFLTDSLTNEKIGYSLGFIKPWYQGKEYVIDTFLIAGKHQGKVSALLFRNDQRRVGQKRHSHDTIRYRRKDASCRFL